MARARSNNSVTPVESFIDTPDGGRRKVIYGVKGAINEHVATTWLMRMGYDVFRNAAPVGRADLVAKNWETGELIFVDVKSQGYDPDGKYGWGELQQKQHEQERKYAESGIKYLVVKDDGTCHWHSSEADDSANNDKYWTDPRSGKKFLKPGCEMSQSQWSIFSHWMLKYYSQDMNNDQAQILWAAHRSTMGKGRPLREFQIKNLNKVRVFLYKKIALLDGERQPEAANDNIVAGDQPHAA